MTTRASDEAIFKALQGVAGSVPYVGAGSGASSKPVMGPRGGQIEKFSPTTGKPIYFKKWSGNQGYKPHPVSDSGKGGYEAYKKGSVIGTTTNGHPIQSGEGVTDKYKDSTQAYRWNDHVDAHHAHFSLAQYLKNLLMKRMLSGGDTSKLHSRYGAHMDFAKHHYKQALLDLMHGKSQAASQKSLAKEATKR